MSSHLSGSSHSGHFLQHICSAAEEFGWEALDSEDPLGPCFASVDRLRLVHILKRFKSYIPANVVSNLQIMLSHMHV